MTNTGNSRIKTVSLKDLNEDTRGHLILRDRELALKALAEDNLFQPASDDNGPYDLALSVEENRLVFRIQNDKGEDMPMLVLSLKPYKRLIKDYFIIVKSYDQAMLDGQPSRIEAIDMGRRALHNEGAELMMERLEDKIQIDMDTARRLFTLICVLQAEPAQLRA